VADDGCLLDNRARSAGTRLDALAAIFDPTTSRHIDALGIGPGWRCWEVGAGRPSVVRWLAQRGAMPRRRPGSAAGGGLRSGGRPEEELANKLRTGFRALMKERGVDLAYGRKLPRLPREAGLVDVAADAYFPVSLPECAVLETTTIDVIRARLVDHGIATDGEIDRHLASVAAGRLDLAQPPMISAWGRVPGG